MKAAQLQSQKGFELNVEDLSFLHLLKGKPYRWTFIIGFVIFLNLHRIILFNWLHPRITVAAKESLVHKYPLFLAVAAILQMQAYYRPLTEDM